jgi:hypothetical protein
MASTLTLSLRVMKWRRTSVMPSTMSCWARPLTQSCRALMRAAPTPVVRTYALLLLLLLLLPVAADAALVADETLADDTLLLEVDADDDDEEVKKEEEEDDEEDDGSWWWWWWWWWWWPPAETPAAEVLGLDIFAARASVEGRQDALGACLATVLMLMLELMLVLLSFLLLPLPPPRQFATARAKDICPTGAGIPAAGGGKRKEEYWNRSRVRETGSERKDGLATPGTIRARRSQASAHTCRTSQSSGGGGSNKRTCGRHTGQRSEVQGRGLAANGARHNRTKHCRRLFFFFLPHGGQRQQTTMMPSPHEQCKPASAGGTGRRPIPHSTGSKTEQHTTQPRVCGLQTSGVTLALPTANRVRSTAAAHRVKEHKHGIDGKGRRSGRSQGVTARQQENIGE